MLYNKSKTIIMRLSYEKTWSFILLVMALFAATCLGGRLGSAQDPFQRLLYVEVIQGQLWKDARTRCCVGWAPTLAVELSR